MYLCAHFSFFISLILYSTGVSNDMSETV